MDAAMQTPRTLGLVRSYNDLHAILRARAEELNVSRLTIDSVAGVPSGYASKVLAPRPIRYLGDILTFPILGALGLALAVVEDTEALARVRSQLVPRQVTKNASMMLPPKVLARRGTKRWAQQMNAQRSVSLSQSRRHEIARKAACVRWAKRYGH